MDKYLENKVNPLPIIEYNQSNPEIERVFHINLAYSKLKEPIIGKSKQPVKGNVLCVGNAHSGKSFFLN